MTAPMVLAVEGGRFSKEAGGRALIALLLAEGTVPRRLEFACVEVDGLDATDVLVGHMASFGPLVDLVVSSSVPIAGFNLIDASEVRRRTGKPVVFVLPEMPDAAEVEAALRKHFPDWERRLGILASAGKPTPHRLGDGEVYLECSGVEAAEALRVLGRVTVFGKVPEPVRLARMAARAAGSLPLLTGRPG